MEIIKKIIKSIFGKKIFEFLKNIYRNESFVNLEEISANKEKINERSKTKRSFSIT